MCKNFKALLTSYVQKNIIEFFFFLLDDNIFSKEYHENTRTESITNN